jgi:transmembrane sensor
MAIDETHGTEIIGQATELVRRIAQRKPGAEWKLRRFAARSPQHLKYVLLSIAIDRELAELGAELQTHSEQLSRESSRQREEASKWTPLGRCLATSIAVLIVLGVGALFCIYEYQLEVALPGHARTLKLTDGSVLQLGGGSVARWNFTAATRSVTLWRGEAFFDVERDPARPFTVSVGRTVVRARGTTFDVRMLSSRVTVTVKGGQVEVEGHCGCCGLPQANSRRHCTSRTRTASQRLWGWMFPDETRSGRGGARAAARVGARLAAVQERAPGESRKTI